MSMYGLTQNNPSWTDTDVESVLDANICRCTGYRPIIKAFKSITPGDIEDSHLARCSDKAKKCCKGKCCKSSAQEKPKKVQMKMIAPKDNANWHKPLTLEELYSIIASIPASERYSLICGDTAQAVIGTDYSVSTTIYTRSIPELSMVNQTPDNVLFGANVTISQMITHMKSMASSEGFSYLEHLADMWHHVAGTSVRNLGSWAGNIATRIAHSDFPSDLYPNLMVAGATVTLGTTDGSTTTHTLEELLGMDLVGDRKVILLLTLPKMADNVVFRVFKVSPRSHNAHAFINGGFRFEIDAANAHTVVGTPVIVYGCINTTFYHATATESVLAGKSLEDQSVVQAAVESLASEIKPDESPLEPAPAYKVAIAQNMLYKTILGIIGDVASPDVSSGATDLVRPLSSGKQVYDENQEIWPLGQPIPKIEAHIQCSGEAEYAVIAPEVEGELFGMFVTSTQANAKIVSIDPSEALKMPGVVAFVGIEDITGENNINNQTWPGVPEPLFPSERVSYYGQPLGLLVTEGRGPAYGALGAVKVTYDDIQPPVLTIDEALQKPFPEGQPEPFVQGDVEAGFAASTTIVTGAMGRNGQYHFAMEPQVCIVTPTDEGFDVLAGTQWASECQRAIGQVLGIPDNKITVTVKRLGGAFGSKIDRCNILSTAASLAAQKTRKRVRVALDFDVNTTLIGWREPYLCTYKAGVNAEGILQAIEATLISDAGYIAVDISSGGAAFVMPSCYACPNWNVKPQFVLTNTANNTWCRSPGTNEGMIFMENILDHIATEIGMDPLEFRRKNLMPDGSSRNLNQVVHRLRHAMAGNPNAKIPKAITITNNLISDMIDQIMVSADVDARKADIETFNQNNKWKKRGLAVMTQMWPYAPPSVYPFSCMVSINCRDGTVLISHGGVESGQGINTKVAQSAAYELGIPLDMIAIKGSTTHTNANSQCTGGSLGSDITSYCVSTACRHLKERLEAFRQTLEKPDIDWPELVSQAYFSGIDISERYVNTAGEVTGYGVFGVAVTEVELDVLTGQFLVLRTDILEDAGRSLSPLVDIGQVEGGFIMGQGMFTMEEPIYDPVSGQRLTNSTWTYKPPLAQDIPIDFRVTLLQDSPNPLGFQLSKVTGEPPLVLAFSVVMALRQAVASARADGGTTGWFQMDTPLTVEKLQRLCLVDPARLVITT
ncbi:xanthine dehydrogenase/oxidase-like isoform X2 [Palaemon carinicauda]